MRYAHPGTPGAIVSYKARYGNFINGRFVPPLQEQYFVNSTPVTGAAIAEFPRSDASDIERALDAAHAAAPAWGRTSVQARSLILLKIAERIEANLELLAVTETWDNGKPIRETLNADIPLAADHFRYFAGCIRAQEGSAAELDEHTAAYHFHEPLGVVGQIIPWNFPLLMAAWKLAPALAAGNCVVLKPAEQTPLGISVLLEVIGDLLPPGVLNVVHGGAQVADMICDHPDIAALSFIGSTHVGQHIYRRASDAGKRVQSMMGAKNHAVVMPDANKEQTLNALVGAAFGAAGQRCMALSVAVMVGESKNWIEALVEKAKTLSVNAGHEPNTDIGPVISARAKQRVEDLISSGVAEGAKLLLDGRGVQVEGYEQGNFVGQTIFSQVTAGMRIYKEEIFGPVLAIICVDTLEEAIALVNANPFGNGVGLFTQSGATARAFQHQINIGQVGINIPIPVPVPFFSFTGSRGSKLGDLGPYGKQAVQFYTQTKTVTSRWFEDTQETAEVNTTINLR